jgi:hypothetical protein
LKIIFLGYTKEGVDQIAHKVRSEKNALANSYLQSNTSTTDLDLDFKVFLSHKRSTGQGIAGRLYEGLKNYYKVFLDSVRCKATYLTLDQEAKFNLNDLQEIVRSTEVFIFIITHGVLLSKWCYEELASAVESNKKVL